MKKHVVIVGVLVMLGLFGLVLPGLSQEIRESRLDTILAKGTINIGILQSFPPMGFFNSAGEPDGFDADISLELAKALGVKVKWVPLVDLASVSATLITNKTDVNISNLTRTLERAKTVDFTDPYIVTGLAVLARVDANIRKIPEDLAGKNVGVPKGTIGDVIFDEEIPEGKKLAFDTVADTLLALKQGKVIALLEDMTFCQLQVKENPGLLEVTGGLVTVDANSFAIARGQPEWRHYLNMFIDTLVIKGKYDEIYKKWFGPEAEPVKLLAAYLVP